MVRTQAPSLARKVSGDDNGQAPSLTGITTLKESVAAIHSYMTISSDQRPVPQEKPSDLSPPDGRRHPDSYDPTFPPSYSGSSSCRKSILSNRSFTILPSVQEEFASELQMGMVASDLHPHRPCSEQMQTLPPPPPSSPRTASQSRTMHPDMWTPAASSNPFRWPPAQMAAFEEPSGLGGEARPGEHSWEAFPAEVLPSFGRSRSPNDPFHSDWPHW